MDDTFLYAHHYEELYTPTSEDNIYMYYNFISEKWNTVDYGYLTSSLNSKLGIALTNEVLSYTGTLSGVMASISNPAPSFLSVMTCMSIINIESMSVSYSSNLNTFHRAIIKTDSDLYDYIDFPYENTYDYYFRQINLSDAEDYSRNYVIKKQLFNSIPVFLGSFFLFDKMKKEITNKEYIDIFKIAYNISSFVFTENLCYPLDYNISYGLYMCNYLLFLDLPRCLLERGQYNNIKFYTMPIKSIDYNSHNILFRNAMPLLRNDSTFNNYIALVYRYLFHSQFSNYDTAYQFSKKLRTTSDDFKDYIFDTTTINFLNEEEVFKIGFDSVIEILIEVQKRDNKKPGDFNINNSLYNENIVLIYDDIIKTSQSIFNLYNEYMTDIKKSSCTIKSSLALSSRYQYYDDEINNIDTNLNPSEKGKHNIGKLTHINSTLTSGKGYDLYSPFFGNYLQPLHLNSGFIEGYYSNSGVMLYLRYNSVQNVFCKNINKLVNLLNNNYSQTNDLEEPSYNQEELNNYNISSIKDHLEIPDILSEIIPEQSIRGYFEKSIN